MKFELEMNRRFLRSVNLAEDCKSSKGLKGYVITPSVRAALARVRLAFAEEQTERAFTLTGPYGTGKSSFALFLWNLLQSKSNEAWTSLMKADAKLAELLSKSIWGASSSKHGYLVLTVTARRASVSRLFADAFEGGGASIPRSLRSKIENLAESRDTKKSMSIIAECVDRICECGYRGVFFIFDEFGKVFEQAKYNEKNTDVFLLQEMAEAASRRTKNPMFFLGMLHQSFADYSSLDSHLRNEFSKIEGRFEPIAFTEPLSAQIQLAAAAFPEENKLPRISAEAGIMTSLIRDVKLPPILSLSDREFEAYAKRAYPLHPLTLAALPLLFRRFGQNERSIFSFLTSGESRALQDFVSSFVREGRPRLLRLCDLYDYFYANFESHLTSHSGGQAFLEANALISSKGTLSEVECNLIKTVAVLTSLGMQSQINASEAMIGAAMMPDKIDGKIKDLLAQSVFVYRKFNKTYALWGGSDIDLRDCYEQADAELAKEGFSISDTLRRYMPPQPVIAKRHTIEKGSLRYFEVEYAETPKSVGVLARKSTSAAGHMIVCLPTKASDFDRFLEEAKDKSKNVASLVFAIPGNVGELSAALMEVRRLNWIEANVRGLRDDRVARREVAVRLAAANQAVAQHQYGLLDPRPAPRGGGCVYIHNGKDCELVSFREVSVLLSDVCDDIYSDSPVVLNELINKRNPSSQAAAARRVIINALINPNRVATPQLGIEGFPPERSIYESVLALSGIHRQVDGEWVLSEPDARARTHLLPAWRRIENLIFQPRDKPLVIKELYQELAKPPFGVLEGLIPILLAAFYALNKDEVSLYYDNTFVPDPQESNFELLLRRPDLFAVSGMHVSGMRQRVVERLARGLNAEPKVLSVVRNLYSMMNQLTKYARETDAVSTKAKKFRQAFFGAMSPERLIFVDLPKAFGLDTISDRGGDAHAFDGFFGGLNECIKELSQALPNLIDQNRRLLLKECGFDETAEGWKDLYDKSSFLLARIGGNSICPFLQNVVNTMGDWDKADQVLSYVQQTPISKWGTSQISEFKKNVKGVGERFKAVYRPFAFVAGSLSGKDKSKADELAKGFRRSFGTAKKEVLRAALLACLSELDNED